MKQFYSREIYFKDQITIKEQYGYLNFSENNIYVSIYSPESKEKSRGLILICDTLWMEQERSLTICVNLARTLALEGFRVLRFDYSGSGNSNTEGNSITFDTLKQDCQNIISWYCDQFGQYLLKAAISLRVGCHINFIFPEIFEDFEKHIFVHPIVDTARFISRYYIQREINQNKIKKEDIVKFVNENPSIELGGFLFSTLFVKQLLSTSKLWDFKPGKSESLFIFDKNYREVKNLWNGNSHLVHSEIIKLKTLLSWDKENLCKDSQFIQSLYHTIVTYLEGDRY